MDYVINPMWIYWANTLGNLHGVAIIMCMISITVIVFSTLLRMNDDLDKDVYAILLKINIPLAVISVLLIVFLPTKETILEMIVANLATKTNIRLGVEELKELIQFIANAFKK